MPNPTYLPVPLDHLNNQHPTYPKINMFSSSNNGNIDPLVSLPFFNDTPTTTNTNCSKPDQDQDHLLTPFSLFNFPSPFSNYNEDDTAAFLHPLMDYSNPVDVDATTISVADPSKKSCPNERHGKTIKQITRKRSSKKDRHSKINTAQGPRDRRMRLSLEVARKFFDLQDMLGFDKASKTVEWLLTESKSAIKELSRSCKLASARSSPSNTSECDVASGIFDESMDVGNNSSGIIHGGGGGGQLLDLAAKKERKTSSKTQKSRGTISPYLARESRKQARARAKERTMEKMWIRTLNTGSKPSANEEIGNCHWDKPLEIVEESRRCGIIQQLGQHYSCTKPAMGDVAEFEEAKRSGIIEEHMVDDTFANSGDYLQSSGISQQRQFRDSQLFSKPWEGYNYLC